MTTDANTIKDMVNRYIISGMRVIKILSLEDAGNRYTWVKFQAWGNGSNGEVEKRKLDWFAIALMEGRPIYNDLAVAITQL